MRQQNMNNPQRNTNNPQRNPNEGGHGRGQEDKKADDVRDLNRMGESERGEDEDWKQSERARNAGKSETGKRSPGKHHQ